MTKDSSAQTLRWIVVDVATPQWIKDVKTLEAIGKAAAETKKKKLSQKLEQQLSVHKKPWFEAYTKNLKLYKKQLEASNAAKAGLPPEDIAGLEKKIIAAKKKAAKSPAAQKQVDRAAEDLRLHIGIYIVNLSAFLKRIAAVRKDLAQREKDMTLARDVFAALQGDFKAIVASGVAFIYTNECAIYMLQCREATVAANGCLSGIKKLDNKLQALAVEASKELRFVERQAKHIATKAYVEELAW